MGFNIKQENIKYIKISYKDIDEKIYTVKAGVKLFTAREIIASTKIEDNVTLRTPQNVDLNIICNDGLYYAKTTLKTIEKDVPYLFFILETPQDLEYQQNREFFRVQAEYKCILRTRIDETWEEVYAKTCNLSANGVSIETELPPITNETSELEIKFEEKSIRTKLEYIRSENFEEVYRTSFSYKNISNPDKDYIAQICIKKQIEQKRNALY